MTHLRHKLVLSGTGAALDGALVRLAPARYAVLKALAREPGRISSRRELLAELPSGHATHEPALEAAVARLRGAVRVDLVRTVVKRGYRLAAQEPV